MLHQDDIDVLHNVFSGNLRPIKVKSSDIVHVEIRVTSDEWGNLIVADIIETDDLLIL